MIKVNQSLQQTNKPVQQFPIGCLSQPTTN